MILLIDNYDSFVFNLARYIERLGQSTHVLRNDEVTLSDVRQLAPDAIVISPGPCSPEESGVSVEVVKCFGAEIPTLGICLGHQAIAQAYGATIVRSDEPKHGQSSEVYHNEHSIYCGIPSPFPAARYHSLTVDPNSIPPSLEVNAWLSNNIVMGIHHSTHPVYGFQFHPESILTRCGYQLVANFLRLADLSFEAVNNSELVSSPMKRGTKFPDAVYSPEAMIETQASGPIDEKPTTTQSKSTT